MENKKIIGSATLEGYAYKGSQKEYKGETVAEISIAENGQLYVSQAEILWSVNADIPGLFGHTEETILSEAEEMEALEIAHQAILDMEELENLEELVMNNSKDHEVIEARKELEFSSSQGSYVASKIAHLEKIKVKLEGTEIEIWGVCEGSQMSEHISSRDPHFKLEDLSLEKFEKISASLKEVGIENGSTVYFWTEQEAREYFQSCNDDSLEKDLSEIEKSISEREKKEKEEN